MDRRNFLGDLTRYAAMGAAAPSLERLSRRLRFADTPFMLGVASGDPLPTGGVLWTRIAPRPIKADWGMDGVRARVALAAIGDRQIVEYVSRAGAPKITASSWRCEHARAGVMKV